MKCYDVQIDQGDTVPKVYNILAKNIDEAFAVAKKLLAAIKKYEWEDSEVINVSLNHDIAEPDALIAELKKY